MKRLQCESVILSINQENINYRRREFLKARRKVWCNGRRDLWLELRQNVRPGVRLVSPLLTFPHLVRSTTLKKKI